MMLSEIIKLKDCMQNLLTRYNFIKTEDYEKSFKYVDKISYEQQQKLYQFLKSFYDNHYIKLYMIFRMPLDNSSNDETLWDRYFLAKKVNLIEMKMIIAQYRICRDQWKRCPRFRPKEKEKKEKGTNGEKTETNNNENLNKPNAQ